MTKPTKSVKEHRQDIISLTKAITWLMFGLCVAADIAGYYICKFVWENIVVTWGGLCLIDDPKFAFPMLIASFYIVTIFGYVIIVNMLKLLKNIQKDVVFVRENTQFMKNMSLACFAIFVLCFISVVFWPALVFIGVIGLFMGLIVLCVKLVIDKAIDMREELDYTV